MSISNKNKTECTTYDTAKAASFRRESQFEID
jgi:hypothetical protein